MNSGIKSKGYWKRPRAAEKKSQTVGMKKLQRLQAYTNKMNPEELISRNRNFQKQENRDKVLN